MLAQGVELRVISETPGHNSLGMTAAVYAGVVPALGHAAAARMDEALGARNPDGIAVPVAVSDR